MENNNIVAIARCDACGWEIKFLLKLNEYGFYEEGSGFCPKCFTLLNKEIKDKDNPDWGEKFGGEKKKVQG